jgi:hypothetical protein
MFSLYIFSGAGGYDAVFAIVVDQPQVVSAVEELWAKNNILTLLVQQEPRGVLVSELVTDKSKQSSKNALALGNTLRVLSFVSVGVGLMALATMTVLRFWKR